MAGRSFQDYLRFAVLSVGAAGLGLMTWNVVRAPYPPSTWLTAEAPRVAVVNRLLPIRVTLPSPGVPGLLMADLQWYAFHREPRGFLSHGTPLPVPPGGGVLTFEIPVPARPDLKQVRAVIYLGPTPRWEDRLRAVVTAEIPVGPASNAGVETSLRPLLVHENVGDPEVPLREVPWGRPLIAALWVVAAFLAWRDERPREPLSGTDATPGRRWHCWLSLACLAAAAFEFGGGDVQLAARLRVFAQELQLYHERRWLQQAAMLLIVSGAAAAAWVALRRIRNPALSLALLGLGLFAVFSLADVLSLHQVDQMLALRAGPLPFVQLAKLASAATAVAAFWPRHAPAGPAV